jgi:RNA 3'-terminal phosphate cyclase (ATP)
MRALGRSCAAEMTNAELGALSISFLPTRRPKGLNGSLDLSEGETKERSVSVPTILNTLIPVLAGSGMYSQISLTGETYSMRSLSYDYFQNVTIPALRRFGLYALPEQEVAGFGRESGGLVTMDVEPSALNGVNWAARGKLVGCHAVVTTSELPMSITERGIGHLEKLAAHAKVPIEIEANPVDSRNPGAFVTVWAVCERGMGGATAIGRRGLKMETLAQSAFEGTLDWLATDATVDPYLADQLLVTACLAEGETTFRTSRLTQRFLTAIWVIKQFLPIHITVRGTEDHAGTVTIKR